MTIKEFYEFLLTAEDEYEEMSRDCRVIGVRWEELDRNIGDEVGCSKHNLERENEGDMPSYGSEEYENMFELNGASSLSVRHLLRDLESEYRATPDKLVRSCYMGTHCYLIGGKYTSNQSDAIDDGELVIVDAKVIVKLY